MLFMPEITFNMQFKKLHNQKQAELLDVRVISINDKISKDFLNFDCIAVDGQINSLKKGKHLLLTFLGDKNIPFTTVRNYIKSKEMFYKENLNKTFQIVICPF